MFLTMVAVVSLVVVTNKDSVLLSFNRAYKQASFYYTLEDPLDAVATNEYSYRNLKMFPYPFLENALLLEPWREGTITVTPKKEGCILAYTIVPDEQWQGYGVDLSHTMSGSDDGEYVFFVTPTKTGKYTMKVTESCSGLAGRSLEKTVWVKYVKRELQSLNDYDREEFLDTYHKMWEVSKTEGKLKYGDQFRSVYYFAMIHNDAGADAFVKRSQRSRLRSDYSDIALDEPDYDDIPALETVGRSASKSAALGVVKASTKPSGGKRLTGGGALGVGVGQRSPSVSGLAAAKDRQHKALAKFFGTDPTKQIGLIKRGGGESVRSYSVAPVSSMMQRSNSLKAIPVPVPLLSGKDGSPARKDSLSKGLSPLGGTFGVAFKKPPSPLTVQH